MGVAILQRQPGNPLLKPSWPGHNAVASLRYGRADFLHVQGHYRNQKHRDDRAVRVLLMVAALLGIIVAGVAIECGDHR